MKVTKENGLIKVQSDYSAEFVKRAKMLQGKWKSPCWVFPEENEPELKALLLEIYGENGDPQETVDLIINIGQMPNDQTISLGGYLLASRKSRDYAVTLGDNVILVSGGFPKSGGSAKYPYVDADDDTVVKAKGVPMALYERFKDSGYVKLAGNADSHREKLLAERERLLARLAEINAELGELEEGVS